MFSFREFWRIFLYKELLNISRNPFFNTKNRERERERERKRERERERERGFSFDTGYFTF